MELTHRMLVLVQVLLVYAHTDEDEDAATAVARFERMEAYLIRRFLR